jgi:tight adherence protein C
MKLLFYLCVAVSVFLVTAIASWPFLTGTPRATVQRLLEITHHDRNYRRDRPVVRDAGRKLFAALRWLRVHCGIADEADLPERLACAGYKGAFATNIYCAARALCPAVALLAGTAIPVDRLFWVAALPALAFIAPNLVLTILIRRRREKIRRSIPDTVDLLVICVDAGLGLDQALLQVGLELGLSHPEITEELLQINREQRAGKPRTQAWADMAKRSDLRDIDAFASMLLQTDRFGTPIARALSTFADNIRLKRRQLAEQMAAKTTIKIIFPLVLCIFPSIFIVLLAPAVLNIIHTLAILQ